MEKEPSSNRGSVKQAKSEFVERSREILFQFDEDPSNASKDRINREEQLENVDLDEKFEAHPQTPVDDGDMKTEENN